MLKVNIASNKIYLTGKLAGGSFFKEQLTLSKAYELAIELLLAIQENMTEDILNR